MCWLNVLLMHSGPYYNYMYHRKSLAYVTQDRIRVQIICHNCSIRFTVLAICRFWRWFAYSFCQAEKLGNHPYCNRRLLMTDRSNHKSLRSKVTVLKQSELSVLRSTVILLRTKEVNDKYMIISGPLWISDMSFRILPTFGERSVFVGVADSCACLCMGTVVHVF